MLSKNFKSNKYYEVTRYWFKYGNEEDALENTVTVWDTFEKAIAYIERYATGLKFESASIEEVIVDREITANDYKHGDYEYVSIQKIYDVTLEGVEDFTKGKICYFEKSEQADETLEQETGIIKTMDDWQKSDLEFKDFAKVGDVVDESIVNWFAECVPPITYNSDLIQCGEAYGHRDNPRTGRFEGTYITFAKTGDKWIYKGHCFFGEQKNIA